jgi:hypothetical protein
MPTKKGCACSAKAGAIEAVKRVIEEEAKKSQSKTKNGKLQSD